MDRVRGPCQCSGLHTGIFNTSKMPRWFSVFSLHSDLLRMVQEAQVLEDVWGLLVDARKAYPRVFATGLKSRRLQTVFGNPMVGGPYQVLRSHRPYAYVYLHFHSINTAQCHTVPSIVSFLRTFPRTFGRSSSEQNGPMVSA